MRRGAGPETAPPPRAVRPFAHPGLLHSRADLERMRARVAKGEQPGLDGWKRLTANRHIVRGTPDRSLASGIYRLG